MDLWVVAAAAGAGYLAKYWQKILQDKEASSGSPSGNNFCDNPESPSLIHQIRDKTCSKRKLSDRKTAEHSFSGTGNGNHSVGISGETSREDVHIPAEDGSMPSSSIYPPEFRKYKNIEEQNGGNRLDSDTGDIPEYQTWDVGASHGSRRSKKALRSKHLHLQFIKPRSSLDSCLMAQMSREHAAMEEYLLSPLASPCTPTFRPFLVSDGRRVISRANVDFRDGLHKEVHPKANGGVIGVPPLPQIMGADYSKEKLNKGKKRVGKATQASAPMQFDSQGSSSGQGLFCLGISIGIMSTIIANKLELEKLKENLKQSENLVQDLQEELEMKDLLTVKELAYDDDSQDTHEYSCSDKKLEMFSNQVDTTVPVKCTDDESESLKEVESISKIEAELEAELERLELSMKGSSLQGRLTDTTEFDQEFDEDVIADLVHGELKADSMRRKSSSEPTPDRVSSTTLTPVSAKYAVSPHKLTLRLHEVIQSRLEKRITELEVELAKSQKHVRVLESEKINSWREISNSESSSTVGSPIAVEACSPIAQPLVMTLSGDALDAYNEAFEELNMLKGSQNEAPHIQVNKQQENQLLTSQGKFGRQDSVRDCNMTWLSITGEEPLPSSEQSPNGYEHKDDDDEDLLLIKQIVEKARQGSPAVIRAQKAMVRLAKDDH